jgi:hypothetical protein
MTYGSVCAQLADSIPTTKLAKDMAKAGRRRAEETKLKTVGKLGVTLAKEASGFAVCEGFRKSV